MKTKTAVSRQFQFKNFTPEQDLSRIIDVRLRRLFELVPNEASISGVLERMGVGYRCRLWILAHDGPIVTEVLANDPQSAVVRLGKRLDAAFPELALAS